MSAPQAREVAAAAAALGCRPGGLQTCSRDGGFAVGAATPPAFAPLPCYTLPQHMTPSLHSRALHRAFGLLPGRIPTFYEAPSLIASCATVNITEWDLQQAASSLLETRSHPNRNAVKLG